MDWTDADIQVLRDNWLKESASAIAERLGRSRNAIIGMAHRLSLPRKDGSGPRKRVRPTMPRAKRKPPVKPEPASTGPVPLLEATSMQCKAIIDNMKDEHGLAMVCGKPIVESQAFSFCSKHLKRFTTSSNRGYRDVRNEPINK